MTKRQALIAVLSGALVLWIVPMAATSNAQTECTWEIGVMGPLSGDYAFLGQPIANGIELAVQQTNDSQELACTLDLFVQDSQGDPNQAPPLANDIVDRERVVACLCGFFSGETLATGNIFDRAGILMASTGTNPVVDDQGFDTWFRTVANDTDIGRSATRYIVRELKPRRVVLVRDRQDYGSQMTAVLKRHLDWRVEEVLVIDETEVDHSRQVAKARAARSDLVVFGGFATEAGRFLRQLRQGDVTAPYMTLDAVITPEFQEAAGGRAAGTLGVCSCSYPGELAGAKAFADDYRARFGRSARSYAGDMFDIMNIVVDALGSETSATPIETIRANIVAYFDAADRVPGMIKPYTWERDGDLRARGRHAFFFRFENDRWHMRGSVYDLTR